MHYREFKPSAPLQPYIDCYWSYSFDTPAVGDTQTVNYCLPLGTAELIIHLDDACDIFDPQQHIWKRSHQAIFTGIYDHAVQWKAGAATGMFGIRIKPEALTTFFHCSSADLVNKTVDAHDLLSPSQAHLPRQLIGAPDTATRIRLTEQLLLARLPNEHRNYVHEGIRLIRSYKGVISIDTLSTKLFVSRRQLERTFRHDTGITPKTYQQIVRFRNLYHHIKTSSHQRIGWAGLSYCLGYSDQAHLVRDCKKYSSLPPAHLASLSTGLFQSLEASPGLN